MGPDPLWIPFLSITLGIGTILTLIITLHRAKMRELDQRHRERLAAIEKGLDPGLGSSVEGESPRMTSTKCRACRPAAGTGGRAGVGSVWVSVSVLLRGYR
jgi:hypothetical protein